MTLNLLVYDAGENEETWVEDATAFDYADGEVYIATKEGVRYFVRGSEIIGANSEENDNGAFPTPEEQ